MLKAAAIFGVLFGSYVLGAIAASVSEPYATMIGFAFGMAAAQFAFAVGYKA